MLAKCLLSVFVLLAWSSSIFASVKVVGTPVVFTNVGIGGSDEIQAPPGTYAVKYMEAGAPVTAAWWSPMYNIGDLTKINYIGAEPNGTGVNLVVGGLSGRRRWRDQRNAWVQITVFAQIVDRPKGFKVE